MQAASSSDYPAARHSQPDAPQQPLAAAQPRLPPPFPAQQPQPAHQLKPSGSGSFNQRWLAEQASASTASAAAVAAQGRVPSLVGVKVGVVRECASQDCNQLQVVWNCAVASETLFSLAGCCALRWRVKRAVQRSSPLRQQQLRQQQKQRSWIRTRTMTCEFGDISST